MKRLIGRFIVCGLLLFPTTVLAASETAVEHNKIGTKLVEQGKLDAAIIEFQKALDLDAKYFPACLNLAYAYDKMNRVEEAIAAYRAAIDAQPQSFFAHNNLGVLYDKQGLYDSAIAEFETAAGRTLQPAQVERLLLCLGNEYEPPYEISLHQTFEGHIDLVEGKRPGNFSLQLAVGNSHQHLGSIGQASTARSDDHGLAQYHLPARHAQFGTLPVPDHA